MIEIDGSMGEGGGQVLRTSLALSVVTGQPVRLSNIRANRRNPGLAPQHLAGVLAAAQICDASVEGAVLRSQQVTFEPAGPPRPNAYVFDIPKMAQTPSAGAVTLLLQTVLLPLALYEGASHLTLRGGTHVAWSPPLHYVEWVLLPALASMGLHSDVELKTWGWYPVGGGQVEVAIHAGVNLHGINITERGNLLNLRGLAVAANLSSHIPQRMANRANNLLQGAGLPASVKPRRVTGPSTGAGLVIAAEYEQAWAGFTGLGKKGKPSDKVAEEAAEPLIAHHRQMNALDPYLPDQLLPFMALADGGSQLSTSQITQHTLTNIDVIRRFVDRSISIHGVDDQAPVVGEPGMIRVG